MLKFVTMIKAVVEYWSAKYWFSTDKYKSAITKGLLPLPVYQVLMFHEHIKAHNADKIRLPRRLMMPSL